MQELGPLHVSSSASVKAIMQQSIGATRDLQHCFVTLVRSGPTLRMAIG
jgi:hypothetical protein